ncbi:MAG TPA: flavodoxin [Alicyclobacillus sp.]|nr:flavodoxin [Alicyclobacillus sp.]
MTQILIVYDPRTRSTVELAEALAGGVAWAGGTPCLRSPNTVTQQELVSADGLALGTPNWTGVTGFLKSWLDGQSEIWEKGALRGKAGAAFASADAPVAGLEFTLWSLLHWMLANGMIVVGLPWSDAMRTSGSYYGATVVGKPSEHDLAQSRELGRRLSLAAQRLSGSEII